jgi:hypothetical protein
MTEYRVVWCQCPTAYHSKHVVFVEAETPKDAVERNLGVEWFTVEHPTEPKPAPPGRVLP